MDSHRDGGPVFPVLERVELGDGQNVCHGIKGMSLLDYFAGQAMQSFIQADPPDRSVPLGEYAKEISAGAVVMAAGLITKLQQQSDQSRQAVAGMLQALERISARIDELETEAHDAVAFAELRGLQEEAACAIARAKAVGVQS